jgi:hypothetical protein
MTCQEFEEVLPDYLERSVNKEKLVAIDHHLRECAACQAQVSLWEKLSLIPDEQPSAISRRRFDLMMNAYEEGRSEQRMKAPRLGVWSSFASGSWMRSPVAQVAFGMLLVIFGLFMGKNLTPRESNGRELAALHQELTGMRQLMVLSMLQQPSASERLQGVSWSSQTNNATPEILSALLHTVRHDSSVDVRLAALDALRRYKDQPQVRQDILESLKADQSPLVQIALIDLLVELREARAVQYLKNFQQSKTLNPTVRQRTEWGINELSRG